MSSNQISGLKVIRLPLTFFGDGCIYFAYQKHTEITL